MQIVEHNKLSLQECLYVCHILGEMHDLNGRECLIIGIYVECCVHLCVTCMEFWLMLISFNKNAKWIFHRVQS